MHDDAHLVLVGREKSLADLHRDLEEELKTLGSDQNVVIIFPKQWQKQIPVRVRQEFFALIAPLGERIIFVSHDHVLLLAAEDRGLRIVSDQVALGDLLADHTERNKALRHFSEGLWQEWLQIGWKKLNILSVHKLSVWLFLAISMGLFFTVLFIALPSARIRVWPRVSLVSHTANILLVASGSTIADASGSTLHRRYTLPLLTISSDIHRSLEFDEISKKFLGENAEVEMSFINETQEEYSFRAGTRLANQAGMVFRTLKSVIIPSATPMGPGVMRIPARANPKDLYEQIIGERGNVPAGLKWEVLGLPLEERELVYARNTDAAIGGITQYGTELSQKDLDLAQKQMEQELLSTAKVRTEEEVKLLMARTGQRHIVLQYDVLTSMSSSGVVLPINLIGQSVSSIPIEGELTYSVLAYNKDSLLELLLPGLLSHIEDGQELISGTTVTEGISVHVIEYDDNLKWVKITAELTGKQRSVLHPITVSGRSFGERTREAIQGKTINEAERIIQNFTEVERVKISLWPPWRKSLPALSSNIVLQPME